MLKRLIIIPLLFLAFVLPANAQMLAIKTDGVADLAMMPNLGVEIAAGNRITLGMNLFGSANIYGQRIRTLTVEPEFRWYPVSGAMDKLFIGACGFFNHYNVDFSKEANRGDVLGGGVTMGWVWPLTRYHWNIEAQCAFGIAHYSGNHRWIGDDFTFLKYNKDGTMFMPFRLGVSISYIIHYKNERDSRRHHR